MGKGLMKNLKAQLRETEKHGTYILHWLTVIKINFNSGC